MITVSNQISPDRVDDFIQQVFQSTQSDANLSPRSKASIYQVYRAGHLLLAQITNEPIGWLLRFPLDTNVQELAVGYVKASYRQQGVFKQIMSEALKLSPISIAVTFTNWFADSLITDFGFRKSSLWEIIVITKTRFLFERLTIGRLFAIGRHYQKNRPIYLVYKKS